MTPIISKKWLIFSTIGEQNQFLTKTKDLLGIEIMPYRSLHIERYIVATNGKF